MTSRARSQQRWLAAIGLAAITAGLVVVIVGLNRKSLLATAVAFGVEVVLAVAYQQREKPVRNWVVGARAEREVGLLLNTLPVERFVVLHDLPRRYEGNVDHVVSGPTGVYLIETKHRRYQPADLVKARRQAKQLHDVFGVWVTPVICFADRQYAPCNVKGVWVTGAGDLLGWLQAQRNPPATRARIQAAIAALGQPSAAA